MKIESIVAVSLLTVYSPISQAIIKALQMLNRSISSMLRTVMMMMMTTINLYIRQTKAQIAISASASLICVFRIYLKAHQST